MTGYESHSPAGSKQEHKISLPERRLKYLKDMSMVNTTGNSASSWSLQRTLKSTLYSIQRLPPGLHKTFQICSLRKTHHSCHCTWPGCCWPGTGVRQGRNSPNPRCNKQTMSTTTTGGRERLRKPARPCLSTSTPASAGYGQAYYHRCSIAETHGACCSLGLHLSS